MENENSKESELTREEYFRAEEAIEQMRRTGSTDLKCLRCGLSFILEDYGSAYVIRCETQGCFKITARGL